MTHSHDRTLLAKLGFADGDRRNADHDTAARFLVEDETASTQVALAALGLVFSEHVEDLKTAYRDETGNRYTHERAVSWTGVGIKSIVTRENERAVSKGSGQYKTTIGFLDGWITASVCVSGVVKTEVHRAFVSSNGRLYDEKQANVGDREILGWLWNTPPGNRHVKRDPRLGEFRGDEHDYYRDASLVNIGIEVKIGPTSTADVIRQINLYREYVSALWVVAVAPGAIPASGIDQLRRAGIEVVVLGESFKRFKEVMAAPAAPVMAVHL